MTEAAQIAGKMFGQLAITPKVMVSGRAAQLIGNLVSADGSRINGHVLSELGFTFANTNS